MHVEEDDRGDDDDDDDDDDQCLQNMDGRLFTFCSQAGPERRRGRCKGCQETEQSRYKLGEEEEEECSRLDSGNVFGKKKNE